MAIARQVERSVAAGVFIPSDKSFYCSGQSFKNACAKWQDDGAAR